MKCKLSREKAIGTAKNGILGLKRRILRRFAGLSIVLLFFGSSVFAAGGMFELKEAAEGVYIARALGGGMIHCNAAVIILEDGIMVVDTHSRPFAARALMKQIKTVTDKPIRYVVDTHYHYDHFQGNAAYLEDCPGVEIIASVNTYRGISKRGIPRVKANIPGLTRRIKDMKRQLADTADVDKQEELKSEISGMEEELGELQQIVKNSMPTITFEKSLVLYDKKRVVKILFLGRGHTDGDTVVYLPKEKILCTGDLLHAWGPYMPDCYPYEWIETLAIMEGMDFEKIISGHGDVLEGKGQVTLWKNYLKDVMEQAGELYGRGYSLEEIKEKVDLSKYIPLMDEFGDYDINLHIEKAYNELSWGP
ncbi:MBL fold metallo-hydrolase [Planctomycetota bacterium]